MFQFIPRETPFIDPNTREDLPIFKPRQRTLELLEIYQFEDDAGEVIPWTAGQIEIIDCILHRSAPDAKKRIEIIASTQYGKSLAVAAGVVIRASLKPEKWAIVAGTKEKAQIIMEYVIMLALNNGLVRKQLDPQTPLDRLRMRRSADRLVFKRKGEVRVYSAEAGRVSETSKSLMGFGAANVIEDESALIGDILQSTVMRMLGASTDNFLIKIGNPFNRGHFYKTWKSGNYYRIFIDYVRAIEEGRYTEEFIAEMKEEALFDILYACLFPGEESMDLRGWLPLLTVSEIERAMVEEDLPFLGNKRLGNDVAGGGRNYSTSVLRSYNYAKKIYKAHEPDTMIFTGQIMLFRNEHAVAPNDVFIDKVGVGKGAHDRLHELDNRTVGVNAGDSPEDKMRYVNLRAEMYWRTREWVLRGGKLSKDDDWYQLSSIKYKVADSSGKIKIMSKEEMLQEGIDSPDVADALAMTFARQESPFTTVEEGTAVETNIDDELDPYA